MIFETLRAITFSLRRVRPLRAALPWLLVTLLAPLAFADRIENPTAAFSGLDKITGRIIHFNAAINETVQFGSLLITPRICDTSPTTEAPDTESFIEVDELDAASKSKQIFSGWVNAASPGLNGIEHPIYDVWLTECKGGTKIIATEKTEAPAPDAAASLGTDVPPNADLSLPAPAAEKLRRPARRVVVRRAPPPMARAPLQLPKQRFFPTNVPTPGSYPNDRNDFH